MQRPQRCKTLAHAPRAFTVILSFLCFTLNVSTAAAQQLPQAATPSSATPVQVGVAAAVQGKVEINSQSSVGHEIAGGRPIYMGDVVTTDGAGRLQILLLDETVFTIGPNSAIVIDEFVYDPSTADGRISAQVLKGVFRFVTGKIAHKEPKNMEVTLPAGTIGVRGTMVTGKVEGDQSMVALLGPGPSNQVGARIGKIDVSNAVGQHVHTVTVSLPGHGTVVAGANIPPTPPAPVPPAVLQALNMELAAPTAHPQHEGEPHPSNPEQRSAPPQEGTAPPKAKEGDEGKNPEGNPPPPVGSHQNKPMGPLNTDQAKHMRPTNMPESGEAHQPPGSQPPQTMTTAGTVPTYQPGQTPSISGTWNTNQGPYQTATTQGTSTYQAPNFNNMTTAPTNTSTAPQYTSTYQQMTTFDPQQYFNTVNNTATQAAQQAATQTSQITNGIASYDQLRRVETGQFHWSAQAPFRQHVPFARDGTMTVKMNIDFGSRAIGGGNSSLSVDVPGTGNTIHANMAIAPVSFSQSTGLATFSQSNGPLTGTFAVENVNGVIGQSLKAAAVYQTSTQYGTGSAVGIDRQDGAAPP